MSDRGAINREKFGAFSEIVNDARISLNERNRIVSVEKERIRGRVRDAYSFGLVVDVGGSWGEVLSGIPPQDLDRSMVVDYSPGRVAVGHNAIDDIEYVAGDGFRLPLAGQSASVVVCSEVIEHVEDAQGLIAELSRVLEPGGTVVLSGPSDNLLKNAFVKAQTALSENPQYLFQTEYPEEYDDLGGIFHLGFSERDLVGMFQAAGLSPDTVSYTLYRRFGGRFGYENVEQISDLLCKPYLRRVFAGHVIASATKPE